MVGSPHTNFSNVTSIPPTPLQDDIIDPIAMKWLWVVFYSIISIVGTVGNTLVILAYRNPRMRSVTNLFIANLGVADLMVTLINVPVTVTNSTLGYWPFGLVLCKSIPYLLGVTIFSSVGTLMAIAADRYRAIVHPLLPRIRTRHAISIIAAIWIVAFIYPIPQIIYQKLHPIDGSCYEDWPSPKNAEIYTVILFVALYLIPLIVISVLYFLICHNLNTTESTAQAGANRAKKSVIRMLVIVVVLFTVCWLPFHVTMLYVNFKGPGYESTAFFQLVMFSMWLMLANSCCNPVVYAVLNRNYRKEFVRLLRCQSLSGILYGNSESAYDRRFSSDTRTFYRNTSNYQDRIFSKRKSNANEDFSLQNGTTQIMSYSSRSGRCQSVSNGSGVEKQIVCVESGL